MSLLTIVRTFCQRTALPVPTVVVTAADAATVQMLALLNEVCEDLCDRWVWQGLVEEALFTTVAGEDQGAITTIAPNGFLRIINETIFNRTLRLPLYGPLAAQKWQALKALPTTGPFYKYRIRGNHLLLNPAGVAGHSCAFEYAGSQHVTASDGTTRKSSFTADDDTSLFPESLLTAGLRWRWKAEKGLDYAEEMRMFETLAMNAANRDGSKPRLDLAGGATDFKPGIWVPAGNWQV